jgi:hypothetical protein
LCAIPKPPPGGLLKVLWRAMANTHTHTTGMDLGFRCVQPPSLSSFAHHSRWKYSQTRMRSGNHIRAHSRSVRRRIKTTVEEPTAVLLATCTPFIHTKLPLHRLSLNMNNFFVSNSFPAPAAGIHPHTQFLALLAHKGWTPGSRNYRRASAAFNSALIDEFSVRFGDNPKPDLAAWQNLCFALGVKDVPPSITRCKKVI